MKFYMRTMSLLVFASMLAVLAGCGGAGYEIAPVKGKMTFNGEPVKGGSITFRPVEVPSAKEGNLAKPASATVGDDGTFVLTTLEPNDGAAVGTHEVLYTPQMAGSTSYEDKPVQSPYLGANPDPRRVEVKSGSNDIEIKLVPR